MTDERTKILRASTKKASSEQQKKRSYYVNNDKLSIRKPAISQCGA